MAERPSASIKCRHVGDDVVLVAEEVGAAREKGQQRKQQDEPRDRMVAAMLASHGAGHGAGHGDRALTHGSSIIPHFGA